MVDEVHDETLGLGTEVIQRSLGRYGYDGMKRWNQEVDL